MGREHSRARASYELAVIAHISGSAQLTLRLAKCGGMSRSCSFDQSAFTARSSELGRTQAGYKVTSAPCSPGDAPNEKVVTS